MLIFLHFCQLDLWVELGRIGRCYWKVFSIDFDDLTRHGGEEEVHGCMRLAPMVEFSHFVGTSSYEAEFVLTHALFKKVVEREKCANSEELIWDNNRETLEG
jgi:hypothetical protein